MGRSHKVEINGVRYLPASKSCGRCRTRRGPDAVDKAVADLLVAFYLYDGDIQGRGARGLVFDAIKGLAPHVADRLSEENDAHDCLQTYYPWRLGGDE